MAWLQAHLVTDKSKAPLVELLFEGLGALSVTLSDAGDEPLLEPPPGEMHLWQATRVTGLFPGDTDADTLRARINQHLNAEYSRHLNLEVLEDRAWERVWLERYKPMKFGKRLWVCPRGYESPDEQAVVVSLDPGLAFGTGTHPTTALCLEWLEQQVVPGSSLIDYGCGSGILAVAALKLGAAPVTGVDYDPQALTASRQNSENNEVAGSISLYLPEDCPAVPQDFLIANILAGPLIDLAPRFAELVRQSGHIALSGILESQAEEVRNAYRPYFKMTEFRQQDEWCLLGGRRSNTPGG